MEYLLDCRTDRPPSWDEIVFWRDTGWNEDEEAVEALDGVCSMVLIFANVVAGCEYRNFLLCFEVNFEW